MPHPLSACTPKPERREVKITVFASVGVNDPPPDSLAALSRLIAEHPDRVAVYDVADVDEVAIDDTLRASGRVPGRRR